MDLYIFLLESSGYKENLNEKERKIFTNSFLNKYYYLFDNNNFLELKNDIFKNFSNIYDREEYINYEFLRNKNNDVSILNFLLSISQEDKEKLFKKNEFKNFLFKKFSIHDDNINNYNIANSEFLSIINHNNIEIKNFYLNELKNIKNYLTSKDDFIYLTRLIKKFIFLNEKKIKEADVLNQILLSLLNNFSSFILENDLTYFKNLSFDKFKELNPKINNLSWYELTNEREKHFEREKNKSEINNNICLIMDFIIEKDFLSYEQKMTLYNNLKDYHQQIELEIIKRTNYNNNIFNFKQCSEESIKFILDIYPYCHIIKQKNDKIKEINNENIELGKSLILENVCEYRGITKLRAIRLTEKILQEMSINYEKTIIYFNYFGNQIRQEILNNSNDKFKNKFKNSSTLDIFMAYAQEKAKTTKTIELCYPKVLEAYSKYEKDKLDKELLKNIESKKRTNKL